MAQTSALVLTGVALHVSCERLGHTCGVKYYRDVGIVVGHTKLGEADLIVTLLTRGHGLVRAVAKGVRRTKSRFGSRLELFNLVDVQLHVGRNLDIVTQVELIEPFGHGLVSDFDVYSAAAGMAETAAKLSESDPHSREQFMLLWGAVASLYRRDYPPLLSLGAYLLRAMRIAGWEPGLDGCVACGHPGPHRTFSLDSGGVVCVNCRQPADLNVGEDAVALLHVLLEGDWSAAVEAPVHAVTRGLRMSTQYVQYHLERRVKSLSLVAV